MSITVALRHRTSYSFDRPTEVHPHLLRLRPAAHSRTPIRSYSLTVEPGEHFCNWQQDPYGNFVARLVFPAPTEQLVFDVELVAELISINPFDFFVADEAVEFGFPAPVDRFAGLRPFLVTDGEDSPEVLGFVDGLDLDGTRTIDALVEINGRLREVVDYSIRMEPGVQSPTETLRQRIGSCRDSSWLLVQVLRRLGLPARFVSGYLVQLTLDRPLPDGTVGTPHDFTDLHAWAEVYVPGAGWIGLDPTSGLFASEGHIPLAATPDPPAAAPIEGATGVTEVEFDFLNEVTRIHEDPRATKPYSDEQWEAIDRLGHAVDAALDMLRLDFGVEDDALPLAAATANVKGALDSLAIFRDVQRVMRPSTAARDALKLLNDAPDDLPGLTRAAVRARRTDLEDHDLTVEADELDGQFVRGRCGRPDRTRRDTLVPVEGASPSPVDEPRTDPGEIPAGGPPQRVLGTDPRRAESVPTGLVDRADQVGCVDRPGHVAEPQIVALECTRGIRTVPGLRHGQREKTERRGAERDERHRRHDGDPPLGGRPAGRAAHRPPSLVTPNPSTGRPPVEWTGPRAKPPTVISRRSLSPPRMTTSVPSGTSAPSGRVIGPISIRSDPTDRTISTGTEPTAGSAVRTSSGLETGPEVAPSRISPGARGAMRSKRATPPTVVAVDVPRPSGDSTVSRTARPSGTTLPRASLSTVVAIS